MNTVTGSVPTRLHCCVHTTPLSELSVTDKIQPSFEKGLNVSVTDTPANEVRAMICI